MTADKDNIEKVVRTIAEARAWGISVLPPDVNASLLDFAVVYEHPDGNGPSRGPGKLKDRYRPKHSFRTGSRPWTRRERARRCPRRSAGSRKISRFIRL
ncbi:MAG: hypothetical protein QM784_14295 [Polyangiaceae bacterium]